MANEIIIAVDKSQPLSLFLFLVEVVNATPKDPYYVMDEI
jgi:hypothetical protein